MTAHVVAACHFPRMRSGLPAWITCSCGVTVTAEEDQAFEDRHEPVNRLWQQHKATATRAAGRVTRAVPA